MEHLSATSIQFLKDIAENNNRPWFKTHKSDWLKTKADFRSFIETIMGHLVGILDLEFVNADECIFRIYRDVRFSKNKQPYKTCLSASIGPTGKKGDVSGLYIHIDPTEGSFLAGGVYKAPMSTLRAIREEIDENGKVFLDILQKKSFMDYWGELKGDALKKGPSGYPKDHQYIQLLKQKDFLVEKSVPVDLFTHEECIAELIKAALEIRPFLTYLRKSLRRKTLERK